jgi:hypothetical protein
MPNDISATWNRNRAPLNSAVPCRRFAFAFFLSKLNVMLASLAWSQCINDTPSHANGNWNQKNNARHAGIDLSFCGFYFI